MQHLRPQNLPHLSHPNLHLLLQPQEKKRKLVVDTTEAPPQAERAKAGKVLKKRTLPSTRQLVDEFVDVLGKSLKDAYPVPRGLLPPVVNRELEPGKFQPLLEFIFQRRTPATTKPSGLVETSSLYAKLGLTVSETNSDEEVSPETNENLKLLTEGDVRLEDPASSADTSSVPLMTTLVIDLTVSQPASAMIQASIPTSTATTSITTTTTLPPPSPQPQQGISNSIIIQQIGELERSIADQVDANQALEERLDKQGNKIHQLETQDLFRMIREQTVEYIDKQEIDRKIEETVKEAVTASVQYAMRAPLRARFKDLPTSDMKEILLQCMLEENYDKGHEDHRMAYEALQKSILHDESEKFDADKAEEHKKMKSKQYSLKTPPGLPPSPPPPPPPSGASGDSGITGASDSTHDPLPPLETDIQEKNKKKAKNKQNRARSGKDQVKSKSKVIHLKKIQLEGLKLPNLKFIIPAASSSIVIPAVSIIPAASSSIVIPVVSIIPAASSSIVIPAVSIIPAASSSIVIPVVSIIPAASSSIVIPVVSIVPAASSSIVPPFFNLVFFNQKLRYLSFRIYFSF
ncbi:hypothetical protein Tco_0983513 [Tanacetum coccineum]